MIVRGDPNEEGGIEFVVNCGAIAKGQEGITTAA